jgi:hypothetical protein
VITPHFPKAMGTLRSIAQEQEKQKNIEASKQFEKNRRDEAARVSAQPESVMSRKDMNAALAAPMDGEDGAPKVTTFSAGEEMSGDVFSDTGGWSYQDLGDGRIKIVSAPPGSKAAGKTLDPNKIATLPAAERARAERAYASVKSVMSGGEPLAPYRPTTGKKTTPDRDMLGGERAPAASAGGAVDTSALRGDPSRVDAKDPGITPPSGMGGYSEPERPGMSSTRRIPSPVGRI